MEAWVIVSLQALKKGGLFLESMAAGQYEYKRKYHAYKMKNEMEV